MLILFVIVLDELTNIGNWLDRFEHWNGPCRGSRSSVQDEHLSLFQSPTEEEDNDD